MWEKGYVLTNSRLLHVMKGFTAAAWIPNSKAYSGHSFRKGGVTALAKAGVVDNVIQKKGGWKLDAFKTYTNLGPKDPTGLGMMA